MNTELTIDQLSQIVGAGKEERKQKKEERNANRKEKRRIKKRKERNQEIPCKR